MKTLATSLLLAAALAAPPARAAGEFISADAAKALAGKPGTRFVFADSEKEFEKGHLPGSAVAYAHDLYYLDDVKACWSEVSKASWSKDDFERLEDRKEMRKSDFAAAEGK